MIKDINIDYPYFENWLREIKKLEPKQFLTTLDDARAKKLIEYWPGALASYEAWLDSKKQ